MRAGISEADHWKLLALREATSRANAERAAHEEHAAHLRRQLEDEHRAVDQAALAAKKAHAVYQAAFADLCARAGAVGGIAKISVRLEDDPSKSFVEWPDDAQLGAGEGEGEGMEKRDHETLASSEPPAVR